MKKAIQLIALALIALSNVAWFGAHVGMQKRALVCTELYAPALTVDGYIDIGKSNTYEYVGLKYVPASNQSVCAIDFFVRVLAGTLTSSHDYYCRIYALNGDDQCATLLGTSVKIDGDSLVDETWISENAGLFTFTTSVDLTSGASYGIAIFPDQDGNLTDDPEIDGTNYWSAGIDTGNNGDAVQAGRKIWSYAADLPYNDVSTAANDDLLIKVNTMQ